MLHEFNTSISKLKEIVDTCISLYQNESLDTIELSELVSEASDLANACFILNSVQTPSSILAKKEAYDVVISFNRLNNFYSKTREDFYDDGVDEYTIYKNYLTYLHTILSNIEKFGVTIV